MTSTEKVLWSCLRANQLGVKFRKQHPIGPYITDFYARDVGLIVEVDGDTHFTPEAKSYDSIRTDYLHQLGLTVLRFTNLEILRQLDGVIKQIYRTVQTVHPSEHHRNNGEDRIHYGLVTLFTLALIANL